MPPHPDDRHCIKCKKLIKTAKTDHANCIVIKSFPFHTQCLNCEVCDMALTRRTAFVEATLDHTAAYCYSHRPWCAGQYGGNGN